ncbi:MAG: hypothetical protein A2W99_16160 [Bacteroidetes bacterium GWF2_33_16]|nr:MAG: hypothetical protein A2X00_15505 [Bacteroidetes bacterium GWE2_32_14]OFY02436.1 MAG: hypothetical protein A2W99_16160 [Bacteroidetes bacterium GWF2_33_16]
MVTKYTSSVILFIFIFYSCQNLKQVDNVLDKSAYLDTVSSVIPILHLSGNHYENGYQHGALLKNEISELIGLWKTDIESNYKIHANDFIKTFLDSTNYISAIKKWSPNLFDEIKGISDGSGIEFNTIFAFQLIDEMWTNSRLIEFPHHCTSVGVNNFKKDRSSNIIAQNIDIPPFYHGYEVLLDIKINNSRKLVTTFAGYLGSNGLNNSIGITCNSLMDLKSSKDGLPVCCVVRSVLDRNTFEEAEQFIREIKHASGQNYIIGSYEYVKSFECASDTVTEFWPDSTYNYTYHANSALTNTSYHPSFIEYVKNVFNSTPDAISFGDSRLKLMETRIKNNQSINISTIESVLSEKPICNDNTWVFTIMEFNKNYSLLKIKPNNPDTIEYLVLKIQQ